MQIIPEKDPMLKNMCLDWCDQVWGPTWIEDPAWDNESCHVAAFRRVFKFDEKKSVVFHISADQRYTLFLDGKRLGFGPERGDDNNWFYQTYRETLAKGEHRLVAIVWWTSVAQGLSHLGHNAHRPSLLVAGEGADAEEILTTGKAKWEVLTVGGVKFTIPGRDPDLRAYIGVGGRTNIDAAAFPRGLETGADSAGAWTAAAPGRASGLRVHNRNCFSTAKQLRHSVLPPMFEKRVNAGKTRHCEEFAKSADMYESVFEQRKSDAGYARAFQAMLSGRGTFEVPANTNLRVLVDAENYVCAWPMLTVSGGKGATVKIQWAESLYDKNNFFEKGNRGKIEGKVFRGFGDSLACDGSAEFAFEPFWWEAGRYICFHIETAAEALTFDSFKLRETHYPHKFESHFECDDPRWGNLIGISERVLEMCSHETYFDCPYYEQLMYVGDTRMEALATYATTRDTRLPAKAIRLFDESRDPTGLTTARTPSVERQVIPPFSLWWVMMVHDRAFWVNDPETVRSHMPGVRAVLDAFRTCVNPEDGLLHAPLGWNFVDWVGGWVGGVPPEGQLGACASINLQFALVLRAAAELEDMFGEKETAARCRRNADEIAKASIANFWDAKRNLFAENKKFDHYSEHAQCMAILGGSFPKGKKEALGRALAEAENLARCTIYFSFYLFETFRELGMPGEIYARLPLWFKHEELGLFTTVESPEPARSDCHAWGSHPMVHAYATFAGIRPAAPGFKKISIRPQLGPLNRINAKMAHPSGGFVTLDIVKSDNGAYSGTASSPDGVPAALLLPGAKKPLEWNGGKTAF